MSINLTLTNDRKYFWQWDTNQYLITEGLPVGAEIHYDMPDVDVPLKTLVENKDDFLIARVPDELLQYAGKFTVWVYLTEENISGNRTVYSRSYNVEKREKPPDYVYTETEKLDFDTLSDRLTKVEKTLDNLSNFEEVEF